MTTPESVREQLKSLIADRNGVDFELLYQYADAFTRLHEILDPEEQLRGYVFSKLKKKGESLAGGNWATVCTDRSLILWRHDVLSGLKHFKIPLKSVSSIEPVSGWLSVGLKIGTESGEFELFQAGRPDLKIFIPVLQGLVKSGG